METQVSESRPEAPGIGEFGTTQPWNVREQGQRVKFSLSLASTGPLNGG